MTYGRDTAGRISSISVGGTTVLGSVTYEPTGEVSGWIWGNTSATARSFDLDGLLTGIVSSGTRTFGYDDAFRLTSLTDASIPANSWSYGYDAADRLTSAASSALTQGWSYDANGNRLAETGTTATTFTVSSTSNRLDSTSGYLNRTYAHDAAGNVLSYDTVSATYNNAGRLATLTNGSTTATYVYNALGQMVKQSGGPAGTRYYAYDEEGHLLGEYGSSGTLIQETVWLGDIPVATIRPAGAGVAIYYVHTDQLNTPRVVTRPSDNAVVWRWDSDPFGTQAADENPSSLGAFQYNLRFPGQIFDGLAGLHQNWFRDYSPATGRYVQSDPLGMEAGVNPFAYVSASPLMWVDPQGLIDSLPQGLVDVAAGIGQGAVDAITLGFVDLQSIRDRLGIDGGVNSCSVEFNLGQLATLLPVGLTARGLSLAARLAARNAAKATFRREAGTEPLRVLRDRNSGRVVGVGAGKASYRPKADGSYSVTPQSGRSRDTMHYRPDGEGFSLNQR